MNPVVISIDELKKLIPGYVPDKADEFHLQSDKLANKILEDNLKRVSGIEIILMCGGSASGKTEFISEHLPKNFDGIIYDSTLSTIEGAKIKIKKVVKSKNIPVICFIFPHRFRDSFSAFRNRERKIPEYRFYETHSGSRKVALWFSESYPKIEILAFESFYTEGKSKIDYVLHKFDNQSEKVEFFQKTQYTELEIYERVIYEKNKNSK